MFKARDELTGLFQELIRVTRALRAQLQANEASYARVLEVLAEGAGIAHTLQVVRPARDREVTDLTIQELYDARHRLQHAVISKALREGMLITDIAASMGVPPDLVIGYSGEVPGGD